MTNEEKKLNEDCDRVLLALKKQQEELKVIFERLDTQLQYFLDQQVKENENK